MAILVALLSTSCYALAAVLQQQEAARQDVVGLTLLHRLIRRPRWWLAVTATITGALLHVFALRFGPLTLIQPLGVSALVLALPLGAAMAKRSVLRSEWGAAVAVVVGLILVLSVVPHHVRPPEVTAVQLLMAVGGAALLVLLLVGLSAALAARNPDHRGAPVVRAASAAICFGFASAMARLLVAGSGPLLLAAALCGTAAVVGFALVQTAYRNGGLGAPLATCTLIDPISAVTVGVVLLGETIPLAPWDVTVGLAGLAATALGITVLARTAHPAPAPEPAVPVAVEDTLP
ncbi:DMT family transporter [Pseudonocardia sp. GCM10023141]|uniref:DMT family transporter n=1 Tax=Pseudonocardia sp. GCM10023141 TaxID=3252653 RepID=UPI003609FF7C